jgi:hypothetical protein
MKSLPAPPIPKDASRAAKRIHSSQFEPVTQDSLNTLLNLPGIRVTQFSIEMNDTITHLHLSCEHDHAFALCPTCQKVAAVSMSIKVGVYVTLTFWECALLSISHTVVLNVWSVVSPLLNG